MTRPLAIWRGAVSLHNPSMGPRRAALRRLPAVVAGALLLAGLSPSGALGVPAHQDRSAASTRVIGTLTVAACNVVDVVGRQAWCGVLPRNWDPQNPALGAFPLAFAVVLPAEASMTQIPVVALEGGPGYGGIDSGPSYVEMLGPVLGDRALLLMDARGTGRSMPVRCAGLDTAGRAFERAVRSCGESLGPRAGLLGSSLAADDLAALIDALGVGPAIVYGDSYGTYLAQVFAGRHPGLVQGLVLDGAYPVTGETAWYPTQAPALRRSLGVVCARSPDCEERRGSTVGRLERVLAIARTRPAVVVAPGADDRRHRVVITAESLVEVAFNGTYVPANYRELDSSLRAALAGDWLPLGRLVAEYEFSTEGPTPARQYSPGASLGVSCHDYPQLYSMESAPRDRRAQFATAVRQQERSDAGLYAPFAIGEYLGSSWSEQSDCLTWPGIRPDADRDPAPNGGSYPDVPALVLSGELDTITTVAEGALVASQFARSRQVVIANALHVTALGDVEGCASRLVRDFVRDPRAVLAGTGIDCATAVPPIRTMPGYPATARRLPIGVAAAQTVADVIDRTSQAAGYAGLGLRGGSWSYSGGSVVTLRLEAVRLYSDLPVSGTARWDWLSGDLTTRLTLRGQGWTGGWNTYEAGARAVMTRHRPGPPLVQEFPAP